MTKKNIDGSCCVVFPPPPPPPAPVVEHRQYYCSSSTMAWRKTSVTRGGAVGVAAAVVGGLVLMALLVGTTWTAVIHLDDVAVSTAGVFASSVSRTRTLLHSGVLRWKTASSALYSKTEILIAIGVTSKVSLVKPLIF